MTSLDIFSDQQAQLRHTLFTDSVNSRDDPYFRFLLSHCYYNGKKRSKVEMRYKCFASWKAKYASEENDGKVHVFIGKITLQKMFCKKSFERME